MSSKYSREFLKDCMEKQIQKRFTKKTYVKFSVDGKIQFFYETEYIIPDGIKSIADEAMKGCSNLKRVVMPDSIESIGKDIFWVQKFGRSKIICKIKKIHMKHFYCKRLINISLPDGVEIIEEDAFEQ